MGSLYEVTDFERKFSNDKKIYVKKLEIPRGGMIAIIGESGSGKSTFAGALGGLIPRAKDVSGEILLHNLEKPNKRPVRVLNNARPLLRGRVGFIFQSSDLLKEQTTTANLGMSLKTVRNKTNVSKLYELAAMLSLDPELMRAKSATLSGGEAQRVAMLRVLLRDPEVIVADEPTASLDTYSAKAVMDALKAFSEKPGKTVIWVTHDLDSVAKYSDKVLVMVDGEARDETVVENPQSRDTLAAWIKSEYNGADVATVAAGQRKFSWPLVKYISNSLLSAKGFNRILPTPRLLRATGYPDDQTLSLAEAHEGSSFGQVLRSFGQRITLAFACGALALFTFLLCAYIMVEIVNTRTLSGPTLSNVVVASKFELNRDAIDDLEHELNQRVSGSGQDQRIFGRYEVPGEVRRAKLTESDTVSCSGGKKYDIKILAAEVFEPGISQLDFLEGDEIDALTIKEKDPIALNNLPYTSHFRPSATVSKIDEYADLLHPAGDQDFGVIVTRSFLQNKFSADAGARVPDYICLSFANLEFEAMRVVAVVESLSIATSYNFEVLMSEERYRARYTDRNPEAPEYPKAAVYVDVGKADSFFGFFEDLKDLEYSMNIVNTRLSLERGYDKLKEAISVATFYKTTILTLGGIALFLVAYLLSYQIYTHLVQNSVSFLVARAFGLSYLQLLFCISGVYVVTLTISVLFFFLPAVLALKYVPAIQKSVPLIGEVFAQGSWMGSYIIVASLVITTLVMAIAILVSTIIWWLQNRSIHDGIRSS